jgi:hypothetical protein
MLTRAKKLKLAFRPKTSWFGTLVSFACRWHRQGGQVQLGLPGLSFKFGVKNPVVWAYYYVTASLLRISSWFMVIKT